MHVSFDGFEEEIAEIFRLIIPKGIGIELNTNRGNTPLPDEKWLRLYRSLGGEIVTLGTGCPHAGVCGLCRPGGAGAAAGLRIPPFCRLPAGETGVA